MGNEQRYAAVEAAVVDYIYDRTGIDTRTEVPNPLPTSFIQVDRTGGRRTNRITERVQLTILTWAPTKNEASNLATDVRAHLDNLTTVDGTTVYRLEEVGSPASSPDPDRNTPRYQLTVALYLSTTTTKAP